MAGNPADGYGEKSYWTRISQYAGWIQQTESALLTTSGPAPDGLDFQHPLMPLNTKTTTMANTVTFEKNFSFTLPVEVLYLDPDTGSLDTIKINGADATDIFLPTGIFKINFLDAVGNILSSQDVEGGEWDAIAMFSSNFQIEGFDGAHGDTIGLKFQGSGDMTLDWTSELPLNVSPSAVPEPATYHPGFLESFKKSPR